MFFPKVAIPGAEGLLLPSLFSPFFSWRLARSFGRENTRNELADAPLTIFVFARASSGFAAVGAQLSQSSFLLRMMAKRGEHVFFFFPPVLLSCC